MWRLIYFEFEHFFNISDAFWVYRCHTNESVWLGSLNVSVRYCELLANSFGSVRTSFSGLTRSEKSVTTQSTSGRGAVAATAVQVQRARLVYCVIIWCRFADVCPVSRRDGSAGLAMTLTSAPPPRRQFGRDRRAGRTPSAYRVTAHGRAAIN